MRNTIISIVCVALVFAYSIFTTLYVSDFSNKINNELSVDFSDNKPNINIENIKDIYNDRKKLLGIIINRDHTEEVEDIIINLETAVKFDDAQEIYNNCYALKSAIEHIEKLNSFII